MRVRSVEGLLCVCVCFFFFFFVSVWVGVGFGAVRRSVVAWFWCGAAQCCALLFDLVTRFLFGSVRFGSIRFGSVITIVFRDRGLFYFHVNEGRA